MRHALKGAFTLISGVAASVGLLSAAASLGDLDRETLAHTLLAESIVAAAYFKPDTR